MTLFRTGCGSVVLLALITVSSLLKTADTAPVEVYPTSPLDPAPPIGDLVFDTTCQLFALGDVHGDLKGAIATLQHARLVDEVGDWKGDCSVLVQTGDMVDRGDDSIGAVKYIRKLATQAAAVGGRVISLNGNHELLSFEGNYNFASPDEILKFGGGDAYGDHFLATHELGRWMRSRPSVVSINRTVFVHAGIRPQYAALGVDSINRIARQYLLQERFNVGILGDDGPFWTRSVIFESRARQCNQLELSLMLLGANRMVVGHTIQETGRLGNFCNGKLLAIDLGLSSAIFGHKGMFEITETGVRQLYVGQ